MCRLVRQKVGAARLYNVIDLFAGCGGLTLGFTQGRAAGRFAPTWAIDADGAAAGTYAANFGPHITVGEIELILESAGTHIPAADIVIGGPPCQGFSLLNRQRAQDSRRTLWHPFLKIVERCGASAFLIENVPGLLKSPEMGQILAKADDMGFAIDPFIINAADFGVPQTRRRCVILGWRKSAAKRPKRPEATHSKSGTSSLAKWKSVRDAISDLEPPTGTALRDVPPPYDLHFGRSPTALSVTRYKLVPEGGNRFDLQARAPHLTPRCWLEKPTGGTDIFGRLVWDQPSVTIRTEFWKPEKGRYLHPDQHRPITHREAARLMGFPDAFRFFGSKVEIARQIGNAVPPLVAEALAVELADFLDDDSRIPRFAARAA